MLWSWYELLFQKKKEQENSSAGSSTSKDTRKTNDKVTLAINKIDSEYISFCLDSGATAHMVNSLHQLFDIQEYNSIIETADQRTSLQASAKGSISLSVKAQQTKKEIEGLITLSDVLYVSNLSDNIISISRLIKEGFEIFFKDNLCILKHVSSHSIIEVPRINNLYIMHAMPVVTEKVTVVSNSNLKTTFNRWHSRLGHPSISRTAAVIKQFSLPILHSEESEIISSSNPCGSCIHGKQSRLTFSTSQSRAANIIEILHTDIAGPFEVDSFEGHRYRLTIICDKSRYEWNFCIKSRSEVCHIIQKHILYLNTQFGTNTIRVKTVRSDNAKEYVSHALQSFYETQGITWQLSVRYTPQQNGVAERRNRTTNDTARTLLFESKLPKSCWHLAMHTATYLVNRLPSSSLDGKSPFELLFSKKPNYSHLRIFGCLCFCLVPSDLRQKLDPKSITGVFVGYAEHHKGYNVLLADGRILVSRDISFNESKLGTECVSVSLPSSSEREYTDNSDTETDEDSVDQGNDDIMPLIQPKTRSERYRDRNKSNQESLHSQMQYTSSGAVDLSSLRQQILNEDASIVALTAKTIGPDKLVVVIPQTYEEALNSPESSEWKQAIFSELMSIEENNTWNVVDKPQDKLVNIVSSKWVFTVKNNIDGTIERFKARLVARGFSQKHGVDYFDTFSPVLNKKTFRFLLCVAAHYNYEIHTMDVSTAFLNGTLDTEILMEIPEGYDSNESMKNKVLKLHKSLYGLKQAPLAWYQELETFLLSIKFEKALGIDPCLFIYRDNNEVLYLLVYVDDLLVISSSLSIMSSFKAKLQNKFKVRDLGEVTQYLKMRILRDRANKIITIDQKNYLESLLERFNLSNGKDKPTPGIPNTRLVSHNNDIQCASDVPYRECVGALIHLMTNSRPDISFTVHEVCRYFDKPTEEHWKAVKRILRYLKSTKDYKLTIDGTKDLIPVGYADASFADNDSTRRKSTTGIVFQLCGISIVWHSKKQTLVTTSTADAEYVALSTCSNSAVWLQHLYQYVMGFALEKPLKIYSDNNAALAIATNDAVTNANKHIELRFHIIKDRIKRGLIQLEYVSTDHQLADIMTKNLGTLKHKEFTKQLGLIAG